MNTDVLFYLICGAVTLVMVIYYLRRRHKITSFLFGSVTGFLALLLMNRFGGSFGAELPLNVFNIAGSVVLGVPFIAMMIIIRYL